MFTIKIEDGRKAPLKHCNLKMDSLQAYSAQKKTIIYQYFALEKSMLAWVTC